MIEKLVEWLMRVALGIWPIPAAGEDISVYRWRRSMTFVVFACYALIVALVSLSLGTVAIRGFSGFADARTVTDHFTTEATERAQIKDALTVISTSISTLTLTVANNDKNQSANSLRQSIVGMHARYCELLREKNQVAARIELEQINMLQAFYHELRGTDYPVGAC